MIAALHGSIAASRKLAPASFTPADIANLERNYDASLLSGSDNSTVSEWVDAENADAATAEGAPKLRTAVRRERNILRFDGDDRLTLSDPQTLNEFTVFAIVSKQGLDLSAFLGTSYTNWIGANHTVDPKVVYTQSANGVDSYARRIDLGFNILIWRKAADGTRSLHYNGEEVGRASSGDQTGAFTFDGIGGMMEFKWIGDIAQIGLYSRYITDDEVAGLHAGFMEKWGVEASILCDGNSLTYGFGTPADDSYPSQMQVAFGTTFNVVNLGVNDRKTSQQLAQLAEKVTGRREAARKHFYVCWEITNSLYYEETVSDVIADLKEIGQTQMADGFYVIMCTAIPRNSGTEPTGHATNMATVNTEVRNPANLGVYWDVVVDLAADSRLQNPENTTYFQDDKVHLTAAGNAVVESLIRAAILAQL